MQHPEAANMRFGSPADVHGRVVSLFVALGSFLSALRSQTRRDFGERDEIRPHLILGVTIKVTASRLDSMISCP